ncbi:MAG: ATP-dependent DNA ligase [Acidimicrobiia bacterium]|nr:ATP-dependent DNA ligase [Acidimicrobiia bacterium]
MAASTDRLARYREMRDFSVTAEPSGTAPPPPDGNRFVVQRHRATRLHYDLRLEAAGVLISWAVPKGPTLDPEVRRMAVHVEDHPLDYFDFEGVIPRGEYGGGDVVVWDWGTWTLADADDPLSAIDAGNLHFDLHGEKLRGRFVLVRRGKGSGDSGGGGKEQWLLLHKHDDDAVEGWDPEDHPRSVKSGRTNDEVAAAPAASWTGHRSWAGPTPDELDALDALPAKGGMWSVGGLVVKLSSLDRVYFPASKDFPAGKGHDAVTKREVIRHYTCAAPAMLPYLDGRPINLHRFPSGISEKGFWHKAAPPHTPEWLTQWEFTDASDGDTRDYMVPESAAALAFLANYGGLELHPWTSTTANPYQPTWTLIDIDPGTKSTFDDALVLARLFRTALEHLKVAGMPKVTGKRGLQIWVPIADGYTFDDTRTWVETVSRAIGATVPQMVSWEWDVSKRKGLTRLDHTQNAINKTLVAPFSLRPAVGAPVSVPITWDELDDPDLRPDRWTIRTLPERLATAGDPLLPLVGMQQKLPSF